MYYLRSKPAANAIQFTVDQVALTKKAKENSANNDEANVEEEEKKKKANAVEVCRRDNPEACEMCSG
jgi:hypothetical protein